VLAALLTLPAYAAEREGVSFPGGRVVSGTSLELRSVALLRYRVFFKVYVAALYLESGTPLQQLLHDVTKRIEIEYLYGFTKQQFASSTLEGIAKNVSAKEFETLRPRIERLNALYSDVKPGDRYALTYVRGVGTELALNGQVLGAIEGDDMGRAIFSIWFGESPFSPALKRDLLAGS
jgi:hypothetical protein